MLFVFLSMLAAAQSADKFVFSSVDSVKAFSDSLALNAKRKFKFENASMSNITNAYVVSYYEISNTDSKYYLMVKFGKYNVGENKAMEIEGKPEYIFSFVEGRFLDLFPFWKKYFDPNADPMELSNMISKFVNKTVVTTNGRTFTYSFSSRSSSGEIWQIIRR